MKLEKVGKTLANLIGSFVEYDKNNNTSFWRYYMCIRVWTGVCQPQKKSTRVKNKEGELCIVKFKYEKLSLFCFVCGRMGHSEQHCEVRFSMSEDDGTREWTNDIRVETRKYARGGKSSKWLREEKQEEFSMEEGIINSQARESQASVTATGSGSNPWGPHGKNVTVTPNFSAQNIGNQGELSVINS